MLFRDEIKKAPGTGRLVPVKSRAFWTSEPRCSAREKLDTEYGWKGPAQGHQPGAKLEADMSHFVGAATSLEFDEIG